MARTKVQREKDFLEGVFMICLCLFAIIFITFGWGYNSGWVKATKYYGISQDVVSHAGAFEGQEVVEYSCWSYGELGAKKCEKVR